ncbi:hypothetical protein L6164_005715 [Bauhinia variegata]|uniref:Uncharacterized protein n=1 Tax=Bauhinia variegata TaxID=167791 RepID=A0ACB9PRD0_BAUVA|nr:hypothetical protein L6164_005715 [Bauhinia variegata]
MWEYCHELLDKNARSTIEMSVTRVGPELFPHFDRVYICFDTCRKGWQESCRLMVGLDECFLKSYYGEELLAAVSQDGDHGMYPIAVVVVRKEVTKTWMWFLDRLIQDLGPVALSTWTFISNRQKV